MNGQKTARWDVLLVVTRDRYGQEQFDLVYRLIDAALKANRSIQVWACGYVNMLTERAGSATCSAGCCGPSGESDASACCADGGSTHGTTATQMIAQLVSEHPQRFSWVACRTCSDGRGAVQHIPGVLTEPSFATFRTYVDDAAKTIYIGGV